MRQRAVSVDLEPRIEEPCLSELGMYCSENVEKGKVCIKLYTIILYIGMCHTGLTSFYSVQYQFHLFKYNTTHSVTLKK